MTVLVFHGGECFCQGETRADVWGCLHFWLLYFMAVLRVMLKDGKRFRELSCSVSIENDNLPLCSHYQNRPSQHGTRALFREALGTLLKN